MTTPDQRYRSIVQQRMLLAEIAKQSSETSNGDFVVPADLMHRIFPSLHHAPTDYDLNRIAEKCPEHIQQPDSPIKLPVRRARNKTGFGN